MSCHTEGVRREMNFILRQCRKKELLVDRHQTKRNGTELSPIAFRSSSALSYASLRPSSHPLLSHSISLSLSLFSSPPPSLSSCRASSPTPNFHHYQSLILLPPPDVKVYHPLDNACASLTQTSNKTE